MGEEKVDIIDIKQVNDAFNILSNSLNSANKSGNFDLNESFAIVQSLQVVKKAVEQLNICQNLIVKYSNYKPTKKEMAKVTEVV